MPLRPDFCPAPCPDESLYSLLSRYHRLSGHADCRETLHELFGSHTHVVASVLPTGLGTVQQALLPTWPPRAIVDVLTLFPYFRPFLAPKQAGRAYDYLVGKEHGAIKTLLGLVASLIGASNLFRFCPLCVAEDRRDYGQAYWHRSHQLPGVWLCPRHDVPLFDLSAAWVVSQRHQLFLPDDQTVVAQASLLLVTTQQLAIMRRLAGLCAGVLQANIATSTEGGAWPSYRRQAERLGLTLRGGRLNLSGILARLRNQIVALPCTHEFAFFHRVPVGEGGWAMVLLHKPRRALHPLKHLVLADCLGLDCAGLLEGLGEQAYRPSIISPPAAPLPPPPVRDAQLMDLLGTRRLSLRRVAADMGLSVTTLRLEAARLGLDIAVRPKMLSPDRVAALVQDLVGGMPLAKAAAAHGVSLATVYRVQRLQPDAAAQRKRLLRTRECEARRLRLLQDIRSMPLRQSPEYVWLYRNDRAWLGKQVAKSGKRPRAAVPRIDWRARDRALATQVLQWARAQSDEGGLPLRITRARIGRELHISAWLEHELERLPMTGRTVLRVLETPAQFQCRKLRWASVRLREEGLPVVRWRLLRLAGIRVFADSSVWQFVQELSCDAEEDVVAGAWQLPQGVG